MWLAKIHLGYMEPTFDLILWKRNGFEICSLYNIYLLSALSNKKLTKDSN